MGVGKKLHLVHVIDFGLSKKYRDPKTLQVQTLQLCHIILTMTVTMLDRYHRGGVRGCCFAHFLIVYDICSSHASFLELRTGW